MNAPSLHQVLTVFIWFGLTGLIFLLALIARFYERLSGKRTYYQLFSVPALLLSAASARFASLDQIAGDWLGDLSLFGGGVVLIGLCWHTYQLMTSSR